MGRYRLVHVGIAALLSAAAATTFGVAQAALAGDGTPSAYVSIVPCRLLDTRADTTVGPRSTPLDANETVTFAATGSNGECTIPSGATAIATNITVANPSASSFLTTFPAGTERGGSSSLNWLAGSSPVANQVNVGLSGSGEFSLFNSAGSVDVIVDIAGYYTPTEAGGVGPQGPQGPKGDTGDAVLAGLDCTDGQTITYDADTDGWACTDPVVDTDTLAGLSCTTNQSVRWNGDDWECRDEPITASLSRVAGASPCCGIEVVFASYSPNVDLDYGFCTAIDCWISLVDVSDHTSCQVNVTGYDAADMAYVSSVPEALHIDFVGYDYFSDPLYINISCDR